MHLTKQKEIFFNHCVIVVVWFENIFFKHNLIFSFCVENYYFENVQPMFYRLLFYQKFIDRLGC